MNEAPCHPNRGFVGNERVRRNWTGILAAVPDLVASLVAEDQVWSEWEMHGTHRDGSVHLMRGAMVFGVVGDQPICRHAHSANDAEHLVCARLAIGDALRP